MYCYSFDEEKFTGNFDTLEEALAEAKAEGLSSGYETTWIGEQRDPSEWITPWHIGRSIRDYVSESLGDEVGEVAENFSLTPEQQLELGGLVLRVALSKAGLFLHHCWCDVQMNDYSFERLNEQMKMVDAALAATKEAE